MADLQMLLMEIDDLSPDELEQVYRRVVQRRHASYWLIPGENLRVIHEIMQPVYEQTASMSDEEIDATIEEVLGEVRRERQSKTYRRD